MDVDFVPCEDEIGGYTPLERPATSTSVQVTNTNTVVYSDEEGQLPSSSDDSDGGQKVKSVMKRKLPVCSNKTPTDLQKKKKFSVWSDVLQEEAIENEFVDSNFFGGGRGNETYNYRMKYFSKDYSKENEDGSSGIVKMKTEDVNQRKVLKPRTKNNRNFKKVVLRNLDVTADDSEINVAADIAKKLNEPKVELIERVVKALGKQKAIDTFNKTKTVEQTGGIMTLNKIRRRTSGGVYLKLVKNNKLSRREYDLIFKSDTIDCDEHIKNESVDYDVPIKTESADCDKNKPSKGQLKPSEEAILEPELKPLPLRHELELPLQNRNRDVLVPPPSPVLSTNSASSNDSPSFHELTVGDSPAQFSHLSSPETRLRCFPSPSPTDGSSSPESDRETFSKVNMSPTYVLYSQSSHES